MQNYSLNFEKPLLPPTNLKNLIFLLCSTAHEGKRDLRT